MRKYWKYIALLIFAVSLKLYAQQKNDIIITAGQNFDIRKVSSEYFGTPDLWTYILKYNNIDNLGDITPDRKILIPQKKVKDLLSKLNEADKSIQNAVQAGAKVLAEDLLKEAIDKFQNAQREKEKLVFDQSFNLAAGAVDYADRAYRKTKEIREKTIEAIISYKKGTVQKRFPSILKWEDAEIYDNLKENDWARTLAMSLADITFYDLSQIKLNENSQAVIQTSKFDVLGNKTTTKVRLEKGDAYALLFNSPKKKFDLEIKGVNTKINSKYFWVEKNSDDTKLANYNGEISLAVKDSSVVVKKNEGSVVPEGGYPTKPKILLQPPGLLYPDNLAKLAQPFSEFKWTKVNPALSYRLEISSDPDFKKVSYSFKDIGDLSTKVTGLQPGVYYWHVCSADSMGLPGPYSSYNSFVVAIDKNKPYLNIQSPSNNSSFRVGKIPVIGNADPLCRIYLNDAIMDADSSGQFSKDILLKEGMNKLVFRAVNIGGIETEIVRNVYCETDPDFELKENKFGELDNKKINARNALTKLNFTTVPSSKYYIHSSKDDWFNTGYADSLGHFQLVINQKYPIDNYKMNVTTPTGYEKEITFQIIKDVEGPGIFIDPSTQTASASDNILIKGTVKNAKQLFINGNEIMIGNNNEFVSNQKLNGFKNVFIINAVDEYNKSSIVEKTVLFDNRPPKLISYNIKKMEGNSTLYKLIVTAEDETSMKNSAEAKLNIDGKLVDEILTYNIDRKEYECTVNANEKSKPVIEKITLEDYLQNKKTYSVK